MTCKNCEKNLFTYSFDCPDCRTRFIQSEACKYIRKVLVDYYSPKYGEFVGWQEGANCGCDKVCIRKARVKKTVDEGYEQQTNRKAKKASSRH